MIAKLLVFVCLMKLVSSENEYGTGTTHMRTEVTYQMVEDTRVKFANREAKATLRSIVLILNSKPSTFISNPFLDLPQQECSHSTIMYICNFLCCYYFVWYMSYIVIYSLKPSSLSANFFTYLEQNI